MIGAGDYTDSLGKTMILSGINIILHEYVLCFNIEICTGDQESTAVLLPKHQLFSQVCSM